MKHNELLGNIEQFLDEIVEKLEELGIDLADLAIMDHACYRVETDDDYVAMKEKLSEIATLAGEISVNKRLISTLRLQDPIIYKGWRIDAIELPAPKEGAPYPEGLEHVEFVIYEDLRTFAEKYAHLDFEKRAIDRGVNPELGLKLPNSKLTVKFHRTPLLAVVEVIEPAMNITEVYDGM